MHIARIAPVKVPPCYCDGPPLSISCSSIYKISDLQHFRKAYSLRQKLSIRHLIERLLKVARSSSQKGLVVVLDMLPEHSNKRNLSSLKGKTHSRTATFIRPARIGQALQQCLAAWQRFAEHAEPQGTAAQPILCMDIGPDASKPCSRWRMTCTAGNMKGRVTVPGADIRIGPCGGEVLYDQHRIDSAGWSRCRSM